MEEQYGLKQCRLFKGIPENEKVEVFKTVHHTQHQHRSGAMVIQAGERCEFLVMLSSGAMKAEMIDKGGHVVKITDMHPPAILAPAFLFGQSRFYPVNVTSTSESSSIWIHRDHLLPLLMRDRRILVNYLDILSDQGQFLARKVHFHAFSTLREKLISYLEEECVKQGMNPFPLAVKRAELAEFFGVARPSLSRVLSQLQAEGYLEVSGKWVSLHRK